MALTLPQIPSLTAKLKALGWQETPNGVLPIPPKPAIPAVGGINQPIAATVLPEAIRQQGIGQEMARQLQGSQFQATGGRVATQPAEAKLLGTPLGTITNFPTQISQQLGANVEQAQNYISSVFGPQFEQLAEAQKAQKANLETGLSRLGILMGSSAGEAARKDLERQQGKQVKGLEKAQGEALARMLSGIAETSTERQNQLLREAQERVLGGAQLFREQEQALEKARQAEREAGIQEKEFELKKSQAQKPELREVSGNLVRINPDGTTETIFTAPKEAIKKNLQVSYQQNPQGKVSQVIFDPGTGETKVNDLGLLARGLKGIAAKAGKLTAGVKPVQPTEISKLSPTAKAIYANPKLLETFTPTKRGQIIDQLTNAGIDISNFAVEKLNAGQRDNIALFDDLLREADYSLGILAKGIDLGQIASRIKKGQALLGYAPEFTNYRSSIDNMASQLLKLRSGAAVTPQEFERIKGFIPGVNDDEKTAKTKIERFNKEIAAIQKNYIERSTQTPQQIIESVAPAGGDPLGVRR